MKRFGEVLLVALGALIVAGLFLQPAQSQTAPSTLSVTDNADAPAFNTAKTQSAGTEILWLVPPKANHYTRLWSLSYMPGATAHNLYALIPIGSKNSTVAADAAVGATTITVTSTLTDEGGGAAAANDYVAVRYGDGTFGPLKVSGVSGLTLTVPALAKQVTQGSNLWFFGAVGDHALRKYVATASTRLSLADNKVGLVTTANVGQPLLIVSDNATNAGVLDHVGAGPVRVGQ